MKAHIVYRDDWEELYIDGEPVEAHHSIDAKKALELALGEKNVTSEHRGDSKADYERDISGVRFTYAKGYWHHRPRTPKGGQN